MKKHHKLLNKIEKLLNTYSPYSNPFIYELSIQLDFFKKGKNRYSNLLKSFNKVKHLIDL